jgi:hypothetical protein
VTAGPVVDFGQVRAALTERFETMFRDAAGRRDRARFDELIAAVKLLTVADHEERVYWVLALECRQEQVTGEPGAEGIMRRWAVQP